MKAYVDYEEYESLKAECKALKERVEWLDDKLHTRTRVLIERNQEYDELSKKKSVLAIRKTCRKPTIQGMKAAMRTASRPLSSTCETL